MFGLFTAPTPYKGQKYEELKKAAQESGNLFVDPEFAAEDKSLFYTPGKLAGVTWKRPKDICANPKLFVEGTSSGDVTQGRLGNCWFVAASSCLAGKKEIWHKVIPDHEEQEWNDEKPEEYAGIFHFNFWRFGEWIDIVIDDQLPTIDGQLVFIHSQSKNEFWSALLEKAYAKLFGTYESLDGGELAEALEDFTGGIAEPLDLLAGGYSADEEKKEQLFLTMDKEMDRNSLMASAIPAKSSDEMEACTDVGLVKGHAYGITAVKKIPLAGTGLFGIFNKERIRMVRLRNPWGACEWKGAFSDGSPEWEKIGQDQKEKIGLTFDDDGEFYMTFDDYCKHFTNMSICRVVNTSFFSISKTWRAAEMHSEWTTPHRAGGCLNNRETFVQNPQFVFEIPDEQDEILIGLSQKVLRGPSVDNMTIGFTVMKVEENRKYRLHQPMEIVKSSTYKNSRSIFLRQSFTKGTYVILACTFEPGHQGQFLLRVYSGSANYGKELVLDRPKKHWCPLPLPCVKYPQMVTRIKVVKASGLEKQDTAGGADPYCIIKCEGDEVVTPIVKDSLNPTWNTQAIFFRADPMNKEISIKIWNSNIIRDQYMGKARIKANEERDKAQRVELGLMSSKKSGETSQPGKVTVEVETHTNLESF